MGLSWSLWSSVSSIPRVLDAPRGFDTGIKSIEMTIKSEETEDKYTHARHMQRQTLLSDLCILRNVLRELESAGF
jgi:hypothetical protein